VRTYEGALGMAEMTPLKRSATAVRLASKLRRARTGSREMVLASCSWGSKKGGVSLRPRRWDVSEETRNWRKPDRVMKVSKHILAAVHILMAGIPVNIHDSRASQA